MPGLSFLRKFGTVAASPKNAETALKSGAALLVYPGGDHEVHRPIWERHKVDFDGRKGWIRLALEQDVPIVPVVSIGGQETSLFVSRGDRLAKLLMLDKSLRLKVLPISLAVPWGVNVGDFFGHFPLPSKIVVEALAPIDLREEFGADPDLDAVYVEVVARMQAALDALAAERRLPADRMRVVCAIEVSAPPELVWEFVSDPGRQLHYMSGMTRWEVCGKQEGGLGARYRMLMRVRSAEVGGLVEIVEWEEPRDIAWTSVTGVDQRGRWRLRERPDGRTHVEFRYSYGVAGAGLLGWLAEKVAAPTVSGNIRRSLQQLKRQVEHEQLRRLAAERRKKTAAA